MRLITDNEIVFKSKSNMEELTNLLMDEGYVVMLSKEEHFWVINFIDTLDYGDCDRNGVVFMDRYNFEENFCEKAEDE